MIDLRLGAWQDALADVERVDTILADPPYGEKTHAANNESVRRRFDGCMDRCIGYSSLSAQDINTMVDHWSPRCNGWFVVMTSHDLIGAWSDALEKNGRYVFSPIAYVERGGRAAFLLT